MGKIMVVDDDANIRELACALLGSSGYDVCEAFDGQDAMDKMIGENPDLVIVDIMMPRMDGFELCRNIRRYYKDVPILILTARNEVANKVKAFELGADDYVTKPFEGDELIMRTRALLRRYKLEQSQTAQAGALTVDRTSYSVIANGVREDIPMKEFELLFKLASAPGRTFSRNQLIEDIWGFDFDGNERTLDVHVSRLRERFPPERFQFRIVTVRGLGYRLEPAEMPVAAFST
jgi:DNA-binding response OmpR family regulator